jgi:hypothetical protein
LASVLNASNTGFGGLVSTGDSSGQLQLQTANTTAVTIDTSQNVGIGTGTYASTVKTIYVPNGGVMSSDANNYTLAANAKYDSFWKYIITDYATYYKQSSGQHQWSIASSGTAGNSITFTQAMTLDNSGNVGIGTTSPSSYGKLAVNGSIAPMGAAGTYSIDATLAGAGTTVSSGGTVNFSNASGMLVVNQYSNGYVTIYLCGGGSTVAVASVGGTVGSFAYNSGISGYTWTSASTTTYGFFFVRTRPNA